MAKILAKPLPFQPAFKPSLEARRQDDEDRKKKNRVKQLQMTTKLLEPYPSQKSRSQKNIAKVPGLNTSTNRHLPVEVVEKIILFAHASTTYSLVIGKVDRSNEGRVSAAPAITLSAVCYAWREITLRSYPQLWTSIDIHHNALAKSSINILRMYLERSRKHPLDISLRGNHRDAKSLALTILIPHLHRCRTLTVMRQGPDRRRNETIPKYFGSITHVKLSTLTTFVTDYRLSTPCVLQDRLCEAPNLKTVTISVVPSDVPFLDDHRLQQLTSLTLGGLSHMDLVVEEVLDQLSLCKNLEYLALRELPAFFQHDELPTPHCLPKIHTLIVDHGSPNVYDLTYEHPEHTFTLARYLSLPSLTTLRTSLKSISFRSHLDLESLSKVDVHRLIRKASTSLTTLSITLGGHPSTTTRSYEPDVLYTFLEQAPHLQQLELNFSLCSCLPLLIDLFTSCLSRAGHRVVPELSRLSIGIPDVNTLPEVMGLVLKMANCRGLNNQDGLSLLKTITIRRKFATKQDRGKVDLSGWARVIEKLGRNGTHISVA